MADQNLTPTDHDGRKPAEWRARSGSGATAKTRGKAKLNGGRDTRYTRPRNEKKGGISSRTAWSYFMHGMPTEDIDSQALDRLIEQFGGYHPQWLIASRPWRKTDGKGFKLLRQALGLTYRQVAAYLRVAHTTVHRWESNRLEVPFMAVEVLRLLLSSPRFYLSHRKWDGWFINQATGEFVSPDVGKLAFGPEELNYVPRLYGENSLLRSENDRLRAELAELRAENTRLRTLFLNEGVTDELRAMHDRLEGLLQKVGTARVINLPAEPGRKLKEATA